MGEGAGNPPRPGAPPRARPPECGAGPRQAACPSRGSWPEPQLQPRCLRSERGPGRRERGEEEAGRRRGEEQQQQQREEKRGVCRGRGGCRGGDYVSATRRVCLSFIY